MKAVIAKESREATILNLEAQVKGLARRSNRPKCMPAKDLYTSAWIGAIQAVDSFDESRGFKLKSFAERTIRGRILDYFRSLDHLSRGHRRALREGKAFDEPSFVFIDKAIDREWECEDSYSTKILEHIENKIDVDILFKKTKLTSREKKVVKLHFMQGFTVNMIVTKTGYNRRNVKENITSALNKFREVACIKVMAAGV